MPTRPSNRSAHRAGCASSIPRTVFATALVVTAGLAIAHAGTDGFRAYTLESARRLAALRAPVPVPDLALDIVDRGPTRISAMPGEILLVDFTYTRCPTVCQALGSTYAQLGRRLAPEIASGAVRLLSLSFDAARDGPAELRAFRDRHGAGITGWEIGRPSQPEDVRRLVDAFGVVVIDDGMGGYTHNGGVHIVDANRRLVAIHDFEDVDGIAHAARARLTAQTIHAAAR